MRSDRFLAQWRVLTTVVVLVMAGCGGDKTPSPAPQANVTPVDASTAGTIKVTAKANGTAPAPQPINMSVVPGCAQLHSGPIYDQSLKVNNGRLQDAVVWIKSGFGDRRFAIPTQAVVLDQQGCIYKPPVVGVMVGQQLEFLNSDPEAHNVHGRPTIVSSWNFILSRKGATRAITFDKPEVAIPVGCDIHPWMQGYVAVLDNPYFGITPPDGTVTLTDVPAGPYQVACWHAKLGTKAQQVTVEAKGTATVECVYDLE